MSERDVKQVIVMRTDLNMRKGKMIAQGAHASISFLTKHATLENWSQFSSAPPYVHCPIHPETKHLHGDAMKKWIEGSFKKITVKAKSEKELLDIWQKAVDKLLPVSLIEDKGLTEFGGVKTLTCLAIGPAYSDLIDEITGGLELL